MKLSLWISRSDKAKVWQLNINDGRRRLQFACIILFLPIHVCRSHIIFTRVSLLVKLIVKELIDRMTSRF